MLQDVRFALRLLLKNFGFTAVAIATLGLAVAANAVVFSIVNAILIRPLPYANPEQLVRVYMEFKSLGLDQFSMSAPEFLDLVHDARSFSSVGAWRARDYAVNLTGGDRPVAANAAYVSASLLPTLGVEPMKGRVLDPSEDTPGDPRAVVMSYGLFNRAFGADPKIVGSTVYLNAMPVTVVGVMPKGFDYPEGTDLWVPLQLTPAEIATARKYGNHQYYTVARLKPGVTIQDARAELEVLMRTWHAAHPSEEEDSVNPDTHRMVLREMHPDSVGSVKVSLLVLQAAVVFVLLIACANISNLLLARAEARSGEIAVRSALGASRRRIVRQFLTESLVLGWLGAGLGILLAMWGLDAALAFLPEGGVPREGEIHLDNAVLIYAVAVSMGTSLLFGLAPIVHTGGDLASSLRAAGQRATDGLRKQSFRRALIVAEVALAIVLVIGAGLMIRSFVRLQRVDLGFDPHHMAALQIHLPDKTYPTDQAKLAFWTRLRDTTASLPGVESATVSRELPPQQHDRYNSFHIVGRPDPGEHHPFNVQYWQYCGDDYFSVMHIALRKGRFFQRTDHETAPLVVVINEAMAKKFWPNEDPIGQRINAFLVARPGEPFLEQTIVGVAADVRQGHIEDSVAPELYFPIRQLGRYGNGSEDWALMPDRAFLLVRAAGDPRALFGSLRAHVEELDNSLAVAHMQTMDDNLYDVVAKPRFLTMLLTAFAAIALLMAAIGIFGVMSYAVEQRTRELSIRMALGADAGRLQRMLVMEGLRLAGLGVVLGLAVAGILAASLDKWLSHLLFDVGTLDPATYGLVVVVTGAVTVLACWIPARRATRIHPMIAMRQE